MTDEAPEDVPAGPHKMWVQIGEAIHAKVQDKVTAARVGATAGMLDQIEADLAPLLAPVAQRMLDDPETSHELRPILEVLTGPEHFSGSIVISFAVGALLSPVLGQALAPVVQGVANNAWGAAIGGKGLGLPLGSITGAVPLSPAVLAEAVLKAVLQQTPASDIAALSGVDAGAFDVMVQAAGQSIGIQEALLLYRRKQIPLDSADPANPGLLQVLQYSNVNPRFYGAAEKLQYVPLSAGEVVAANLKGHLPDAQAVTMLQEAGIDGSAPATGNLNIQQLLRASAGRPPGIEQMLHLRNLSNAHLTATPVTDADVGNAVRQSDINDAYLPFVMELGHYFPPPRSVVPMLRSGGIDETQARQLLTAYGVGEPWASAFVKEAHTTKTGAVKELSTSQITAQYEARLMPAATALTRIEALGYSAADAQALLDLADEKRTVAMQNATARKIGAEYIGRKITLGEATVAMGAAGIPAAAQKDLVHYWDVEKSVSVHKPSPAQVVGAFRRGEITPADCKLRLQQLGVADADLGIFVADGYPPTKAAQAQAEAARVVNA